MANSPSNQPIRSISLPSRPHPLIPQIDEHLSRLKSSNEDISTSLSQTSSLSHKLSNLIELYDCLDDLILLPQNQQQLMLLSHANCVDELIDRSLKLLDVCSNVKDVLSQVKEHTLEIQSSLRRSNGELSIGEELMGYVNMRKKTKMMNKKCLKDVKGMVVKRISSHIEEIDGEFAIIDVLRKVESVTVEIFESLLEIISSSRSKVHPHKRSGSLSMIMCKLIMHQNSDDEKDDEVLVSTNDFEDVDLTLSSLIIGQKKRTCINAIQGEKLRRQMVKLDSSVQDLEEVLEGLFRCLVRSRANLLNILSH